MFVELIAAGAIAHAPEHASRSHRRAAIAHHELDWEAPQRETVTMYCYTGSRNAAGKWPTEGTAAANAYPLGTKLHVRGFGVVTVEDRSAPGSTDVDLYMGDDPNCLEIAANFGRRELLVRVAA